MPEIVLPGLREVGGGATEAQGKMLREMRENRQILLWSHNGTEQECRDSWQNFLLDGTPDWVVYTNE